MPSSQQILDGLASIANDWRLLAMAWHVYFVALVAALAAGLPRRIAAALLVAPLVSAGALAWSSGNWFNGAVFALIVVLLSGALMRMTIDPARESSTLALVTGASLFVFGFFYPHFLIVDSWLEYAVAAPLGLVPCATLAAVAGVSFMAGLHHDRFWSGVAGGAGLLYGLVGVFRLGVVIDVALVAGAVVLVAAALPVWSERSVRASDVEHRRPLPGDELLPERLDALTHAITIDRPRAEVWPWLAQMGAGSRAGWYSYDFLDNGRHPSASSIVPGLQTLEVGMVFPALPGIRDGFRLLSFTPDRSLVLGWGAPGRAPDVTWAFQLDDAGPGATRLVVRAAGGPGYRFHGLPVWLTKLAVRAVHFVMERKQLLGIARRAEMRAA